MCISINIHKYLCNYIYIHIHLRLYVNNYIYIQVMGRNTASCLDLPSKQSIDDLWPLLFEWLWSRYAVGITHFAPMARIFGENEIRYRNRMSKYRFSMVFYGMFVLWGRLPTRMVDQNFEARLRCWWLFVSLRFSPRKDIGGSLN